MLNLLKLRLNQKGVIHLIPLLLILIGIIAGVYLVQHPQIFKPKASGHIIEWQIPQPSGSDPDNCITSVDDNNYATANCSKVKLKLNLPNPSSDNGFQIVKSAYAAGLVEEAGNYSYCTKLSPDCSQDTECKVIKYEKSGNTFPGVACVNSVGAPVLDKITNRLDRSKDWKCNNEGKIHKDGGVGIDPFGPFEGFRIDDINIPCPENTQCTEKDDQVTCEGSGQSSPKISTGRYCGPGADKDKIFEDYLPIKNCANEGKTCGLVPTPEVPGGVAALCISTSCENRFKITVPRQGDNWVIHNTAISQFPEELKINGEFKAFYCKEAGIEDCADNFENPTRGEVIYSHPVTITVPAKGESLPISMRDLVGISYRDLLKKAPANCGRIQVDVGVGINVCSDAEGVIGGTVYNLGSNCGQAVGEPSVPAPGAPSVATPVAPTGSLAQCGNNPSTLKPGEVSSAYDWIADCSSTCKVNSDCSGTSPWCYQFQDGFHCMSIRPTVPAPVVTTAPAGGAAPTVSRKIAYWRYAISYPVPQTTPWNAVTTDTIPIDLKNAGSGIQSIFFEFADSNKQIVQINNQPKVIAYVRFVAPATTPASGTSSNCPVDSYQNYDIPTLKQKCSLTDLSKLPTEALKTFSNSDLLDIAKSVDGQGGPYKFLSQFDNARLGSFDLEVLKKLPEDRINQLPENLKNAIKGTGASSESASCSSISVRASTTSNAIARVNFTGSPASLKIWLASNDYKNKEAKDVQSWSLVNTVSDPKNNAYYDFTFSGFDKGAHALLMSLHGSFGQMLDGNPNNVVNLNCATTLTVQ